MEWHGMPPEFNTGRLIAGAGVEPWMQAEAGWQAVAADFTAAMATLRAEIAMVTAAWQGAAASKAQAAFEPYLAWMASIIAMAEQAGGGRAPKEAATEPLWSRLPHSVRSPPITSPTRCS